MPIAAFHPAVAAWFSRALGRPTEVQAQAWPVIAGGGHALLAAPTGSGKTLAAFLAVIDALLREGLAAPLPDRTRVLYISPLKALSNDIQRNLQAPLAGIRDALLEQGLPDVDIRAWVRTGDTPAAEREKARRRPPHILVTTPESAYLLLTSASGRRMLGGVRTVIVDEIHALAGNKRGAHLSLTLERLAALVDGPLQRIGISATQEPIEAMARFLVGARDDPCHIIDTGHVRPRDLALVLPDSPLTAVMAAEVWQELYERLEALIRAHRTTLVFVNTRRHAERVAHALSDRLGETAVTAHHGSLSRAHRLDAEQRLKQGELRCLVATASLELGIDIGHVDLVCQLGSPRNIAAFLQRVGRSGHAVGALPRGRLFPLSRDDLVECTALLGAARRGELDRITIPDHPLDVLAQQIVAEVAAREWPMDALFERFRRAWPYRDLARADFEAVVRMLAQGFTTRRGRRGAHLHLDAVHRILRPRRGARLTALTNGGAIPDLFDYDVLLQPAGLRIGTLNEDFAFESLPGDIFLLGNRSYRILKVEQGKVLVEDAQGQPPNIPFWFGEAPGRSDELSRAVSDLRAGVEARLADGAEATAAWLRETYGIDADAAGQLVDYLATARAALGCLPTQQRLVLERFFDDSGDMHLVLHSPWGTRLNRAWGLALRKRFCRKFNFELQAAALEDSIVLSLSASHSFPLAEVAHYLQPDTVRHLLIQALLDAPMFPTHWRWNATIALAVPRFRGGRRAPPWFQRADAEDLVAAVFPDQIACFENIAGEREVPDHPLVNQTLADCLQEVMDCAGLERVLRRLAAGEIDVVARDLTAPSPLAQEVLAARPWAFLDDAPAEERRTLAVQSHGFRDPAEASALARPDPAAVEAVRRQAWPRPRDAEELHDALVLLGFVTPAEMGLADSDGHAVGWAKRSVPNKPAPADNDVAGPQPNPPHPSPLPPPRGEREAAANTAHAAPPVGWAKRSVPNNPTPADNDAAGPQPTPPHPDPLPPPRGERKAATGGEAPDPAPAAMLAFLAADRRATTVHGPAGPLWVAAERLSELRAVLPEAALDPPIDPAPATGAAPGPEVALRELLRSRLEGLGPVTAAALGAPLGLSAEAVLPALLALEAEGFVIRGQFTGADEAWCERRLLARIHRETLGRLRAEIAPVPPAVFMHFLCHWQGAEEPAAGPEGLAAALDCLEGFSAPAAAWERDLLPLRCADYQPALLDGLCMTGRFAWLRLVVPPAPGRRGGPVRHTPIALVSRAHLAAWRRLFPVPAERRLSGTAQRLLATLESLKAAFFFELVQASGLLRTQVEEALGELVTAGLVTADGFAGLRALLTPPAKRPRPGGRRGRHGAVSPFDLAGRWSLLPRPDGPPTDEDVALLLDVLLRRYGVVYRALLARESLPVPWRQLLHALWRREARGELRGGRFVEGVAGEQFALPEAVPLLRRLRRTERAVPLAIPAADPLNLQGIVLAGQRLSSLDRAVLHLQGGRPRQGSAGG